jgi:hypothetical protein
VTTPAVAAAAVAAWAVSLSACSSPAITAKTLQATTTPAQSASAIAAIVRQGMRTYHLRFRRPRSRPGRTGATRTPATYRNTGWGTPVGANETTNIYDLIKTAVAVGTGGLLSRSSYHAMTDSNLLGFGHKQRSCAPPTRK